VPFSGDPIASPDDEDYVSYKIGGKFRLLEGLHLKANMAKYYRYPNFSELFGNRGNIIGNPDLDAEEGRNRDIGLSFERRDFKLWKIPIDRIFLETAYFDNEVDDLIQFVQTSQRIVTAINISSAEIKGVETSWAFNFFNHIGVSGNYTFQDTENTSDIPFLKGNRLPGRPEDELFNRVEIYNRWARLFYEYNLISDNFLDQANFEKVDRREIHNLGLSIYPFENMAITLEGKNLSDKQISDVLGFPLPGRSFFATVFFEF
jgi:iron complex outermembrane receptor protein